MATTWASLCAFALKLPEVEVSTSYRTPALKVRGKLLARLRTDDDGSLMVRCSTDDKQTLVLGDDDAYFTTSHYEGHGSVLVHLDLVDEPELRELIRDAWLIVAPARLRATLDGR